MNQSEAKEWLPLIQAVASGKTLQYQQMIQGTNEKCWNDLKPDSFSQLFAIDCRNLRIKPREFKNFSLPWEFIEKRWNFGTYAPSLGGLGNGVMLYEDKPEFIESGIANGWGFSDRWSSLGKVCTWIALNPAQEGINQTEWLACRNAEVES